MAFIKSGTCSWKYPSWAGMIYSAPKGINYLEEYAKVYDTVEVDQWFWSLFAGSPVKLPNSFDVEEYDHAVPDDFRFTVKVPNSITLTHFYRKAKSDPMTPNPDFLSPDLFGEFLARLDPIKAKLGPLIFQFEYLNKQKMPSQAMFMERFESFVDALPPEFEYALEIRNPNYLNAGYFDMLLRAGVSPVLMQGYWMPSITDLYRAWRAQIIRHDRIVIRLHGGDRAEIEKKAKNRWDKIVEPRDAELDAVAQMLHDLAHEEVDVYMNVNNHYEGSAPETIKRVQSRLSQ